MFNKYKKLLFSVICVIVVIAGGAYHFGILCSFAPNAEDLATTQRWYLILECGKAYQHYNIIYDMVSCLSVLIGGMSYFSIRLEFTLFYMMVLGLSLFLIMSGKKRGKCWPLVPLWAFFMILIHTVQSGSTFLRLLDEDDLIMFFPYDYHIVPLIFSLVSVILLQCYMDANKRKRKIIIGCVGILVGGYALLFTDLVYYIIFVCPLLIVLVLKGFYSEKTRKYMMPLLALGVGVIMLTRILPGDFFGKLWSMETLGTSYGDIYGATDWLNLDNLLLHLTNYIKTVMILFNIELSDRPIISFFSILFVVRIVFVVIGYGIVARIVVGSVRGRSEQNGYTITDEILAWAFVLLSCAYIFTRNALYRDVMRYYAALVPLLTILLCRHIRSFMRRFLPNLETIRYQKFYFAGIISALCICQMEPVWLYEEEDSYRDECETVIEYLRQWGVEQDGYALAPYRLYTRLSAMTNGEILFFDKASEIKEIYGEEAKLRYMVVGWDSYGFFRSPLESYAYGSYEEMCENYKAPIRAVDLDYVFVCDFGE